MSLRNRAGFTLIEVMIALVMTAVIGAAVTSVFINQAAFFDRQEKVGFARGVSRGGMNMLVSELRMLERGNAIVSATNKRLTIRAPYGVGVVCSVASGVTMLRMPTDTSMVDPLGGFTGYLYRQADGTYLAHVPSAPAVAGTASVCTDARFEAVSDGGYQSSVIRFTTVPSPTPIVGAPVLFFQLITYEFKASIAQPGRVALFRKTHQSNEDVELVAPFDTAAGFRFFVNDGAAAQAAVPSTLTDVTGVELILDGMSERPYSDGSRQRVPLRTAVFFKNRQ